MEVGAVEPNLEDVAGESIFKINPVIDKIKSNPLPLIILAGLCLYLITNKKGQIPSAKNVGAKIKKAVKGN